MKVLRWSILLLLFTKVSFVFGQTAAISFESLDSLQKTEPRPVVIFLHADWCKFCDNMKNTTFKDQKIGRLLTEQFYFVSFDGESKEDVTFLGRTFRYKPSGRNTGVHELAEQLGTKNRQLTYPTLVFLSPQYDILYQHDGFLSAPQTRKILEKLIELSSGRK